MNRWAANNPELYEQLGHDGYVDYFREAADMECKRQKEEGSRFSLECERCGGNPETCRCIVGAWKQISPDHAVLTDDDREMCRACGELPATRGMYCRRCDDEITEDRLNRGE